MVIAGAVLLGCCVVAWVTFFVGRQIARVLWGILVVIEKDEEQRAILQSQRETLFGDKIKVSQRERR